VIGMQETPTSPDEEARQVAEAAAFLSLRGIPAEARAYRLRQEFFRHGWDMRVRDDGGAWSVTAVKPGRPDVAARGSTEGNALRRALAAALDVEA
jgi:hypothetical protein